MWSSSGLITIVVMALFNFDNCQLEVVSEAISGTAVQFVGMNVRVPIFMSRSQDIRLPHFVTNDDDHDNAGVRG